MYSLHIMVIEDVSDITMHAFDTLVVFTQCLVCNRTETIYNHQDCGSTKTKKVLITKRYKRCLLKGSGKRLLVLLEFVH